MYKYMFTYIYKLINLFIFGCTESLLLSVDFLQLRCTGFSLQWLRFLQSMASRARASVTVAHGLNHPSACGISLDQGSNWCPLHCKLDS